MPESNLFTDPELDVYVTETPYGIAHAMFHADDENGSGVRFDDGQWPASSFMLDRINETAGPDGIRLDATTITGELYHDFCQPEGSGVTIHMPWNLQPNPEIDGEPGAVVMDDAGANISDLRNEINSASGALAKLAAARRLLAAVEQGAQPEPEATPRQPTAHFYSHDENRSKGKRQKANDAAVELLRKAQSGAISREQLSDDDKATLAAYSGNGGALIGVDGKKGSAYEYYTPAPIAEGIWDALTEMGFAGGKILDPSAGTGIFGAAAPANAVVDAVELDQTSGGVNDLVNSGPGYTVTVSPFEAVAAATPDETYDAVVTNVPFGSVADRGGKQKLDPKYQRETLEAYFILRSLDKLRPGGLAAFVVPPRVVTGRDGKDTKLRERASLKAEFLGAYRLPNSVFGAADADTITDVMFFRKHAREAAEKIAELREQDPPALGTSRVLWEPFLEGKYFKGEGKRFVLGEFVPKDPEKFRDVDRVKNPASIPDIAKLLRKLPGSRIDWDALETAETAPIIYRDGDTITQDGLTLELRDGVWVPLKPTQTDRKGAAMAAWFVDPYTAFEQGATLDDARALKQYMMDSGQALQVPGWLAAALREIDSLDNDQAREAAWTPLVVGRAVRQVLDERGMDSGTNFSAEYVKLSDAMKAHAAAAKRIKGLGGEGRRALLTLASHYKRKEGFSALWRGDIQSAPVEIDTKAHGFERLQYEYQSSWIPLAKAKDALGDDFDPYQSDDWCIAGDGLSVAKADDYFVGTYAEFLARIDTELAAAKSDPVRNKLLRQKQLAESRIDRVEVSRIQFNLFSPYVEIDEKLEFCRRFINESAYIEPDSDGKPRIKFEFKSSELNDEAKLIKRLAVYMERGTVTTGGAELNMGDAAGLKALRKMVTQANEQFNAWSRGNQKILQRLEDRANDPAKLRFREIEDEAPLTIPGMNPELTLHGYQNAYVRARSRDFSGINGFDVGLGKTFTALAAVQYAQAIGAKKKTLFVVPNSVLSNWKKEVGKAYAETSDCLYVGLRNGKVQSSAYDEDLNLVLENRHRKIFVTMEAFERIRLKDGTIEAYESYLRRVDASFAESEDKKKDEQKKGKVAGLLDVLKAKSGAAPYLEDMGIDSIVSDEAHAFKNSSQTVDFKGGKYLSLSAASKRGLDAQAKAWHVRGSTAKGDGVMLLTATPITNSPLEIFSMLALAVGHERVNDDFLGTSGADGFMNAVCRIESEEDITIDGIIRETNVFKGLTNVEMLRDTLRNIATIKTAQDVGGQITVPDAPEQATPIALPEAVSDRLSLYKAAYRYAADEIAEKDENRGDPDAYDAVSAYFGEPMELVGHPFNLINKMTMLIADPDLDKRLSRYLFPTDNQATAERLVEQWNAKKPTEKRTRPGPNASEAEATKVKTIKNEDGDVIGQELTMPVKVWIENDAILLDSVDATIQDKFEQMAAKVGLSLDVSVPPKLAALLENAQNEAGNPRGIDAEGNKQPFAKQLIFCDLLGMHNKIKRLLTQRAGIPASAIAIVTGQRNNSAEDILEVQDGFNAAGAENKYRVVIANEKAEVGINLQKGTQAIHHLTIGWTPDSLQQRNGRGVRQGNKTERVTVYYYDADGTFDSAKRTLVNSKADWIGALVAKDGGDQLDIAGGMSREQMDALIESIGDADAVTRIQEQMATKEAEKRASSNREKQRINLDTILRQNEFLSTNAKPSAWVARAMGQLMALRLQITQLTERAARAKTATARAKNENLLGEATVKARALEARINEAATFWDASSSWTGSERTITRGTETHSPTSLINDFLQRAKRGENRPQHLVESLISNKVGYSAIDIEIHDDSELQQEWASEIAMAESMREEAAASYERQATYPGGLPNGVGEAFAQGSGVLFGETPVISKCFIVMPDGALYGAPDPTRGATQSCQGISADNAPASSELLYILAEQGQVLYPGTAEHDAALNRAAAYEDAKEREGVTDTRFTDANPDVALRRETEVLAVYDSYNYQLPPPYFPLPINPSKAGDSELMHSIVDRQRQVIVRWETETRFAAQNSVEMVHERGGGGGEARIRLLRDYAIANGLKVTNADVGYNQDYYLKNVLKESFDKEGFAAFLGDAKTEVEVATAPERYLRKVAAWYDQGDAVFNESDIMPYDLVMLLRDAMRRFAPEPEPEPKKPSGGNPDDIVYVVGDTKAHKDKIKEYGQKGGYCKWQKWRTAWAIKRVSWEALIRDYHWLDGKLRIEED